MPAVTDTPAFQRLRRSLACAIALLRADQSSTTPGQALVLAVVLTAATFALRLALDDPLDGQPTLVVFTVPIMISAYLGGMRAGLLATALSVLGASYYLLPPRHSFAVAAEPARWQLFLVGTAGVIISGLNEMLHQARRHADAMTREHERVGASLRESEANFRQMAEHSSDVIWIVAPDFSALHYVSPGYERLWGRPAPSLSAPLEVWTIGIFPDDRSRVIGAYAALARDTPEVSLEYRIVRPDGTIRWINDRVFQVRDAAGQLIRLTGLTSDITDRRQAEAAAEKNQRHLRGLIDGLGPSMFVALLTPEGILIEINQAPLTAGGLKPEDVLGKPFVDTPWWRNSPEAQERLREAIRRAAAGEASRYDVRTQGAGGAIIDIDFSLQPLRDESGKIVFLVPSASVITERTRAEELLAANQNRLRLLCDVMSKAELTLAEKIAEILRQACLQLGLEDGFLARLDGESYVLEHRFPETGAVLVGMTLPLRDSICCEVLQRVEPFAIEHFGDSPWREIACYLKYRFEAYLGVAVRVAGRPQGILCFTSTQPRAEKFTPAELEFLRLIAQWIGGEIEREQAQAALSANRLLLEKAMQANQQVLDKSLDVVCTVDAAGCFTSISAACETLFGYAPAEMIGRPFIEFVLEDDRSATSAAAESLPVGHELHDFENRYVRKDGSVATLSWSASWSDEDQSIFCVGRDCTVRKQVEEAQAARQVAERSNVAKGEFLSRMSHELRTPMNAILGFAQVLEIEDHLTADQRESVAQILKGGGHLLKLINEVLDISSIEAGRMTLSTEAIALSGLFTETVDLLRPMAGEFGVRIAVIPGESAHGHVQADRQRLKQVLLNLLGNAIKYNHPGGSVTICHAAAADAPGHGSAAVTRIAVTDTGAGLSADQLTRIFHPFERLGAEQTNVEGTGLGLVLARRMVEHMGGTLGVESVVGVGTTFWVELPTAEAPGDHGDPLSDAVLESDVNVPGGDARVLLYIEDNPSNVRLVTRLLVRRPAVQLLCANTGGLGLEMARVHRPDLILLDLHLPDSHGTEVLARLAADPHTGAIPVVMLSADAMPGKRAEMLAAGARAYVTKPLDVRTFLAVVDQFLDDPNAMPAACASA